MFTTAALAETAALVGNPGRAAMLMALMDGRALTAAELARAAGITPQTASDHLARLTTAGLLSRHCQGRHHDHRLASPAVAHMLESIMEAATAGDTAMPRRTVVTGPRDQAMRRARTCYDHLAGQLGVRLADALGERGYVELSDQGGAVTDSGMDFLRRFGMELGAGPAERPEFSALPRFAAGAVGRPDISAPAPETHPLAYQLIRVLDDEGDAIGAWDPTLSPETLRRGLRAMMLTRAYDDRMFRQQR